MKTLHIVVDKATKKEAVSVIVEGHEIEGSNHKLPDLNVAWYIADGPKSANTRMANKIIGDYAVTKLPFILFRDEEEKDVAALYSEEEPITIDRIKAKL